MTDTIPWDSGAVLVEETTGRSTEPGTVASCIRTFLSLEYAARDSCGMMSDAGIAVFGRSEIYLLHPLEVEWLAEQLPPHLFWTRS
jgi:hypothetical protein